MQPETKSCKSSTLDLELLQDPCPLHREGSFKKIPHPYLPFRANREGGLAEIPTSLTDCFVLEMNYLNYKTKCPFKICCGLCMS